MNNWLEIDKQGLQRTLERKGHAWMVFELVQNAFDTDATRVDVTLTKPDKNGKSTLTCTDNSTDGYRDLSEAHTLFGSSAKKADPTMRGRFNAGEKYVIVMCDSAKVTSTTGQVKFLANGKRTISDDVTTDKGTVFEGVLSLTEKDWREVGRQVAMLFPPIAMTYNGTEVRPRQPLLSFSETLQTEIANDRGVLTPRKRKTDVHVHLPQGGETPMIYERGIPVVEHDGKYHVSVEQKIPLNTERDNVTPGYLKNLHAIVLTHTVDLLTEDEAASPWAASAIESGKLDKGTLVKVADKKYGKNAVLYDGVDIGSNKEATSKGANVLGRGAMSPKERKILHKAGVLKRSGEIEDFKTEHPIGEPKKTLTPSEYDDDQKRYVKLIEDVSPLLIDRTAIVKIIKDRALKIRGCTRWTSRSNKPTFTFEVNLAFHDCSDWEGNYYLLLHELAHHKVQRNDHLHADFYETVNTLGAKLAGLTLTQPKLFPHPLSVVSSKTQRSSGRVAASRK